MIDSDCSDGHAQKKQKSNNSQSLISCRENCFIKFSDAYGNGNLKLFEVPEEILSCILLGDELNIIGESGNEAAICTSDKTYAIKKVETSNNVFLIPSSENGEYFSIVSKSNNYYEVEWAS